jgi:hypothetical protein
LSYAKNHGHQTLYQPLLVNPGLAEKSEAKRIFINKPTKGENFFPNDYVTKSSWIPEKITPAKNN